MCVCLKLGSDARFSAVYLQQRASLQFGKTFHVSMSRYMLLLLVLHSCRALHRAFFLCRNFLKEILCTRFPPEAAAVYKLIERKHSICIAKVAQLGKGNGRDHLVCAFMAFPPTYAQCSFLSCHLTLVCVLAAPKYT